VASVRQATFEHARWSQSDYAAGSEEDEEDEGDDGNDEDE
jgi:hypothetical protein